jgi:hypothetical protein
MPVWSRGIFGSKYFCLILLAIFLEKGMKPTHTTIQVVYGFSCELTSRVVCEGDESIYVS